MHALLLLLLLLLLDLGGRRRCNGDRAKTYSATNSARRLSVLHSIGSLSSNTKISKLRTFAAT